MGFHKRFLSEDSIRAFAKNDFDSFETYMVGADAYIISTGWASEIYDQFGKSNEEDRRKIQNKINKNQI